jgi:2-oxoglutarate dehydrogenase E2 component (dihydrolipoamide succinyltransferase)
MDIIIPEVGESVREALLAKWFKKDGEQITKDEPLCEIETDKITLDIHADASGVLSIQVQEGNTVRIGAVVGIISDPGATLQTSSVSVSAPGPGPVGDAFLPSFRSSPSARREMREQGVDSDSVAGTGKGGRITLDDLFTRIEEKARRNPDAQTESIKPSPLPISQPHAAVQVASSFVQSAQPAQVESPAASFIHTEDVLSYASSRVERKPMSPIRRRISERMVAARQQTAMLTTFNEADLSRVKDLRARYREHFQNRHGTSLGLMPFFVKACCEALREFPYVNASIDGDDIVCHRYYDIGVAIGAEKGLVVPILRDADKMHFYEIEQAIADFSEKTRTNRIAIKDLEGGTFSISNGGVYGSMLSTPILNPPQSAVLGMHAIQDRPVVRDGQIVIRPMMYLALSYDHRIIDGRVAVGFLKKVKEFIENPEELLLEV